MDYGRRILELDDKELEQFVHRWLTVSARKIGYLDVQRFSGAGDMGRDVVGFLTDSQHEGAWHNYQCKQLQNRNLSAPAALLEIGKIIYFSHKGEFTLPTEYYLVAPRGISRPLEKLIFNPSKLKDELIKKWGEYCADKITEGHSIALDQPLADHINNFDFARVRRKTLDDILNDDSVKPALAITFGADPGGPPIPSVPQNVQADELLYAAALFEAYGERDNRDYCHEDIAAHATHSEHFSEQRETFFAADGFKRFYRDNTLDEEVKSVERQIFFGVKGKYRAAYRDSLERVDEVIGHAASVSPGGPLAKHATVQVKQGFCHHFFDGKTWLTWKK